MKIKSVELMRNIRDRMSQETQGMSWAQEKEYLKAHSGTLDVLLEKMPNKAIHPTATVASAPSASGDG
ncbi:hypothetical protein [Thiorhodovibrio frisius]|jgi:hypothetical protein|uniref:Uncharacterized protein n=2 Tax=Thiorhodovibrio frisius TaxID=631362 RepID=H8YX32_9GAMM|nr:hypothetical protein [Thiorhodovibrio frisius]EIC23008.1 hypothetical protein Thi970DRAFT_00657 [Thiorhodovibrio frisius]WPL22726.1 hypothetical protein Thiofri_02896 [Thiorhodovibrio frisius]